MIFVAIASMMPSDVPAPNGSQVAIARTFLEALATNLASARQLFTADALVAAGDIGEPAKDFIDNERPAATWMASCRVTSLTERPAPNEAEWNSAERPPSLRGGKIARVEGSYSCTAPGGRATEVKVLVLLKGERIAMLALAPTQTHAEKVDVPPRQHNR